MVLAADRRSEKANMRASVKEGMSTDAYLAALAAYDAALGMSNPGNKQEADEYLVAAKAALKANQDFVPLASEFKGSADIAVKRAEQYEDVAETAAEKADAEAQLDEAENRLATAKLHVSLSKPNRDKGINASKALIKDAEEEVAKYERLATVKATTETAVELTLVTDTGRDALEDLAGIMGDIIDEATRAGTTVTDQASTSQPGWVYSYNETNLTISGMHDTKGSFSGALSLVADTTKGQTTLSAAFGAEMNVDDDTSAMFTTGDLAECENYASSGDDSALSGSCMVFVFDTAFDDINFVPDAMHVKSMSKSMLSVSDGDAGFSGSISHYAEEMMASETPPPAVPADTGSEVTAMAWIKVMGMSGETSFEVTAKVEEMGMDEMSYFMMMVGDKYKIDAKAKNDAWLEGTVTWAGENFGTVMEVMNGAKFTYIDGEVMTYTDLTFTKTAEMSSGQ